MAVRAVGNKTLPLGTKIGTGNLFPNKAYSRFPNGLPTDKRGVIIANLFPAFSGTVYSNAPGFFVPTVSSDTRQIYFDPKATTNGNGLSQSTPTNSWTTAIGLLRNSYPDHLLIKTGSVLRNVSLGDIRKSGRSFSEPMVIAWYGDTSQPRPVFENDDKHFFNHTISNVTYKGLTVSAFRMDPFSGDFRFDRATRAGDRRYESGLKVTGAHSNLRFDDCVFHLCEINFEVGNNGPYYLNRCIFTGAYALTSSYHQGSRPSNMYVSANKGLYMNECTLSYGGWNPYVIGASANMYNHGLYFQYSNVGNNMELTNSFVMNSSAHGVQFRSGGLVENNLFWRNAVNITMGNTYRSPGDYHPLASGTRAHVYNNVISEGRTMRNGMDACYGHYTQGLDNLCTGARWGLDIRPNDADPANPADYQAHNNLMVGLDPTDAGATDGRSIITAAFNSDWNDSSLISRITYSQNHAHNFGTNLNGIAAKTMPDPNRSLDRYVQEVLNVSDGTGEDFEATILNRGVNRWVAAASAQNVCNWFREGADMTKMAYSWTP